MFFRDVGSVVLRALTSPPRPLPRPAQRTVTLWVDAEALEDRGLAVITAKPANERDPSRRELVGCGSPVRNSGVEWRIVDPESYAALDELIVGEVWVSGPSKPQTYFHQSDEKNRDTFHSKLSSDVMGGDGDLGKSYLRTGDLGFFHRGSLYVCGRIKDVIIVRGRNYYPQDIESVFERDDRIRDGCLAAVAVEPSLEPLRDGESRASRQRGGGGVDAMSLTSTAGAGAANASSETEKILLVSELRNPLTTSLEEMQSMASALAADVREYTGLPLWSVMFIQTRSVPKTTSGKIARSWVKRGWIADSLKKIFIWKEGLDAPAWVNPQLLKMQAAAAAKRAAAAGGGGGGGGGGGRAAAAAAPSGGGGGDLARRFTALEERLIEMDARQQMELICWQRYHFEALILLCLAVGVIAVRPWAADAAPGALHVSVFIVLIQLLRVLARLRPFTDKIGGGLGLPAQGGIDGSPSVL